ncbi:MAG TPA: hypothetical protein VFS30_04175 [Dehalococcoidia bacterium]|nr:hypothetical protein [Dehalococcoidia bacterium]
MLLSYRLTNQDFSAREASVHSRLEDEAFFMLDRFHYPENHRFSADDQSRESSAGFLFAYELVQIIGYDALSTAVQDLPDYFFGQDAIDAIFDATPEENTGEVRSLIAKWCRRGERNYFTREEFEDLVCSPSD